MDRGLYIICISLLIQTISACYAIRLVILTGKRLAGFLIFSATFLMAFRRFISLYRYIQGGTIQTDQLAEVTALAVSFLFLLGIMYMTRLLLAAKAANDTLASSERRFRMLSEASFEGIVVTDHGRIVDANPQLLRMLNYDLQEIVGRQVVDFIMPQDRDLVQNNMADQSEAPYENRLLRKDGMTVTVETRARHFGSDGKVLRITALRDITERKAMEELLRQSKNDWENTFDTIADIVTVHDLDYNIIRANRVARSMLNLPLNGDLAVKCYQAYHGMDSPPDFCSATRCAATGKPVTFERFEHHFNREFEISAVPRFDFEQRFAGMVHVVRDITDRKRMEEELLRKNQIESLGMLAGGIAHDFNNLLQGILGNLDVAIMYTRPEEKSYPLITHAADACLSAKDLSGRLLTFACGGAPQKSLVPMGSLIRDWVSFSLSGSAVTCDFDIHPDCCVIRVDEVQMRQVIQNIVINAIEAMPEGGRLQVSVRTIYLSGKEHLSLKEGPYLHISVRDEGQGIPDKLLDRIFDPYVTTKKMKQQKGTGLGLTISYSIIRRHGGGITVESEQGKGTTVDVYLPYHLEGSN